ncbi:hypothetical protein OPT61_g9341 [Boeremia exigua]|uniref:Uncharacterized protein n=1 Tax=Boeremia exigua TaxID=749465 RepID=A0ACC2HVH1_9PLEO|nr:hypothetical protein OPT61_g9341 [Boeremia exigua]
MDSSSAASSPAPNPKLGPENTLYDPLPTPTSIRVLLLAPSKTEDEELCCYFFPCDLDKDRAVDPSIPRPFKSLSHVETPGLGDGDTRKRFSLHVDMYNEEIGRGTIKTLVHRRKEASKKEEEPATSHNNVEHTVSEVTDSLVTSTESERKATVNEYFENFSRLSENETVSDRHQSILRSFVVSYLYRMFVEGSEQDKKDWIRREKGFKLWRAKFIAAEMTGKNNPPDLLNDEDWDFLQVAKKAFWEDSFKTELHPFQRFTALSYVWGSPDAPKSIFVDGTRFWVTQNLYDALKSLRRPYEASAFWIDAICINQNDLDEKRLQIGLMRRIYRQADEVLAYIPQTPEDNQSFNKLMGMILRADEKCREVLASGPVPVEKPDEADVTTLFEGPSLKLYKVDGPVKPTGSCIEDHGLPDENDPIWDCWRRFFASPYFQRIWILQEYALAQKLSFQLGRAKGNSDVLLIVLNSIDERSRRLNSKYLSCDDPELTSKAYGGWIGFKQMAMRRVFTRADIYGSKRMEQSLVELLPTGLTLKATDPRDKIYGLLGLVSDTDEFIDLVSYEDSDAYPEIYRRFTNRFIERGDIIPILRMACQTQNHAQMPSWVPDWSASISCNAISVNYNFRAGGDEPMSFQTLPQCPDQLHITGYLDSSVTFMTDALRPRRQSTAMGAGQDSRHDLMENVLTSWDQLCAHLGHTRTSKTDVFFDIFDCMTMQLRNFRAEDKTNHLDAEKYSEDFQNFMVFVGRMMEYETSGDRAKYLQDSSMAYSIENMDENEHNFIVMMETNSLMRRFCYIGAGDQIALVPEHTEIGDVIAVVRGGPVPLVLRRMPEGVVDGSAAYELIGDAYVPGMMRGEVVKKEGFEWNQIVLL